MPAHARPWQPKAKDLALDYSQIIDARANGDMVFIWWLVPQIAPNSAQVQQVLDKYIIIGVAHGHTAPEGTVTFGTVTPITLKDYQGKTIAELSQPEIPPVVVGMIAGLESAVSKTIGAMGEGIHWFTFKSDSVRSCSKGGMTVEYAGTDYTYDTPIPGCPQPE